MLDQLEGFGHYKVCRDYGGCRVSLG